MVLKDFVADCITRASVHESKLTSEALSIEGWSSPKQRHLLNNLCSRPGARYLEIGVWKGSTHVAALYKNDIPSLAIDDFSEHWDFPGVAGYRVEAEGVNSSEFLEFKVNTELFLGAVPPVVTGDFREAAKGLRKGHYNVYFYDGGHAESEQHDGITLFWPALAKESVVIIDDWNWSNVKAGTNSGLAAVDADIVKSWELPAAFPGDRDQWWNGLGIFVVKKRAKTR